MTAQDWMTDLEEDEESPGTATPHTRRWLVIGAAAVVVVLVLAALAVALLGHERTPPTTTATAPAAPSASSPETAVPEVSAPDVGPVLMQAALDYPGLIDSVVPTAPLVVGTQPVQGGAAPDRVPNFDSCSADPASLQYLPVQIRKPENWLSATLTVQSTASTPKDIGRLGFFFQAGDASIPCRDGAWWTSDSFLANLGQDTVTGYVVLDRAFSPSTPQGRAEVFATLRLRISDLRQLSAATTVERRGEALLAPVEPPGGLPKVGPLKPSLPNNHLQYAITWYGLALVVVVMFGLWFSGRAARSA